MTSKSRYTLRRTHKADQDLKEIRDYTVERYGRDAARAYTKLLRQAFKDIQENPHRLGSKERSDVSDHVRSYHVSLSKDRSQSTIKSPRHVVLYFLPKEDEVVISRVLHDSRDLARHLPDRDADRAKAFKEKRGKERKPDRGRGRPR